MCLATTVVNHTFPFHLSVQEQKHDVQNTRYYDFLVCIFTVLWPLQSTQGERKFWNICESQYGSCFG